RLGGMLALRAVRAAPDRWLGLLLISSCARFCAAPDYPHGVAPARVRAMKAALRKNADVVLRQFFTDAAAPHSVPPAALEEKGRAAQTIGTETLAAGLELLGSLDLRSATAGCPTPALILHGRDDRVIPAAAGAWLAGQFAVSRFTPVAGCGHDLPERAPGLLAGEIKGFLETY
ncbi:MAG: alpha/beta fold hydrolase, partial [Kiritimatiellaeota bacterium]|nr:alpha/beta fold hydrolase [Kiritimatiellota bacterium]